MEQIGDAILRRFLCIDEGRAVLSLYDTKSRGPDAGPLWSINLDGYPLSRDLQRVGSDLVLVGYDHGFFEAELSSGRVTHVCDRWKDVTSVCRLDDGATLVTGIDLEVSGSVNVLTLDADLGLAHTASRPGDYVRLMRPTEAGTYLLCVNDHILETTAELDALREFRAPGFLHAWKPHRFPDGATLVSAGYGAFMARFSRDGSLEVCFGGKDAVPSELAPFFYATFQIAKDGHILVANWEGHGPDNGGKGRQLLEFDADGKFLGSWSDQERISSLQGLLLLE